MGWAQKNVAACQKHLIVNCSYVHRRPPLLFYYKELHLPPPHRRPPLVVEVVAVKATVKVEVQVVVEVAAVYCRAPSVLTACA